jgi:hypothetical protein
VLQSVSKEDSEKSLQRPHRKRLARRQTACSAPQITNNRYSRYSLSDSGAVTAAARGTGERYLNKITLQSGEILGTISSAPVTAAWFFPELPQLEGISRHLASFP